MKIIRTLSPMTIALLTGAVTIAGAPVAQALTTNEPAYTIPCDGATHSLGTLIAAWPGERVTFTSPEVGGLLPGTANGSGSIGLIWTCDATSIGFTWHVTAYGTSSGSTTSFTVTGTDPSGAPLLPAADTPAPTGRPTGEIIVGWNYDPVVPRQPNDPPANSSMALKLDTNWHSMDSDCKTFGGLGWTNAANLCRHFLDRTGEEQYIDMPSLIDDERPLWASFEHSIRWEVNDLMDEVRNVPAGGSQTFEFSSQWRAYSISPTAGDWWGALGHINWAVRGDVWVGPTDANGDRPIQIRYRPFVSDMYDFDDPKYAGFLLAEYGWANPFHVKGVGHQRTVDYSLATIDPWSIPFTP